MSQIKRYKLRNKWDLKHTFQELIMPKESKIIAIQAQSGEIRMWAECSAPPIEVGYITRQFLILYTGQYFEGDGDRYKYLATCQIENAELGQSEQHIYEVIINNSQ